MEPSKDLKAKVRLRSCVNPSSNSLERSIRTSESTASCFRFSHNLEQLDMRAVEEVGADSDFAAPLSYS